MPLENYIGAAQVVTVTREHGAITPDDVSDAISGQVERLLIHTWVSDLADDQWPEDFPYPGVELIDWLADRGAVLLGMDSPSVDDFNSKDLAGHNRLRNHGMGHLELLQLKDVPDGAYELIALPLKLSGVCGSPVRAILRQ
jgi:arylformamidase